MEVIEKLPQGGHPRWRGKGWYMWAIADVTESEEANGKDSVPDLAGLTWGTQLITSEGCFSIWSSIVEMAGFAWAILRLAVQEERFPIPKIDVYLPPRAGDDVG